ncbi:MAG: ABC-F family ATP-binding cassette domain-containing protein [Acutalibacteraceae bacterium]
MTILNVQHLCMDFGERNLFTDVTFEINQNEKIGFVGANGVGKTTIFKIITGELSQSSGEVVKAHDVRLGYMEQHACKNPENSVYDELLSVFDGLISMEKELDDIADEIERSPQNADELIKRQLFLHEQFERMGGLTYKSRTVASLRGLGFTDEEFNLKTCKLSGGQRSKLSLAKLLLSGADFLLLDEPTNHLDIHSVEWLEGFLKDFKGAVLVISHDRYFLDAVTNKTIEIENRHLISYTGNYTEYLRKKEKIQEDIRRKYENDLKEIERIEGIIEQQRRWNREKNIKTAESKQKQIDRIRAEMVVPDSAVEEIHFSFKPTRESGNDVVICNNLSKSFGDKLIFDNLSLHVCKGERIFILGDNGCGKTTFFRLLTGEYSPQSGNITYGARVDMGYFDQVQANLNLENTALSEVWDAFPNMNESKIRSCLGAFLFKGDEVFKKLKDMSGGERARVSLLKLMLAGANFMLLDEPTNHLDTASRERLEKTLMEYPGTMLVISHDRYFINKLAGKVAVMTRHGFKEYLGNYDYYLEKQQMISDEKQSDAVSTQQVQKPKVNEYKLKKELASQKRKLETQIKKSEQRIAELEEEIRAVTQRISSPEAASDYELLMSLTQNLHDLENELNEEYANWENLLQ